MGEIPPTDLAERYRGLHQPGGTAARLRMAHQLVDNPELLVDEFQQSLADADRFFAQHGELSSAPFYDERDPLDRDPGLGSTPALSRWFDEQQNRERRWDVLGAEYLSFYYLDRELVSTRAPGHRWMGGSTARGPRLDLLLAREDGLPVIGEVKLTSRAGKRPKPDEDPFYALIQALASAAYLLPRNQFKRLDRHDNEDRLDLSRRRLGIYLLIGDPPEAGSWFELRELAETLSTQILPELGDHLAVIAGLELAWFGDERPRRTRLRITKRFACRAE
jgi:hypothetical protein